MISLWNKKNVKVGLIVVAQPLILIMTLNCINEQYYSSPAVTGKKCCAYIELKQRHARTLTAQ